MGDFPNGTTSSTHGLCKATDCRFRCAHTITLAAGCPNFRLQIAAESNNPSPSPVVLKTRIKRAWRGSGFDCGGNKRARSLDAQKVVTWMNLFHIGEEPAKSGFRTGLPACATQDTASDPSTFAGKMLVLRANCVRYPSNFASAAILRYGAGSVRFD